MPLYEYVCRGCGFVTEDLRSMKDQNLPCACAKCGSTDTNRQFPSEAAALQFKGAGFYVTDYKNKGKRRDS